MSKTQSNKFVYLALFLFLSYFMSWWGGYITDYFKEPWYSTIVKPSYTTPDWIFAPFSARCESGSASAWPSIPVPGALNAFSKARSRECSTSTGSTFRDGPSSSPSSATRASSTWPAWSSTGRQLSSRQRTSSHTDSPLQPTKKGSECITRIPFFKLVLLQ